LEDAAAAVLTPALGGNSAKPAPRQTSEPADRTQSRTMPDHHHGHDHDHGDAHDHNHDAARGRGHHDHEHHTDHASLGHNHASHDHSGHDRSGHDHLGHDHSGHDHDADPHHVALKLTPWSTKLELPCDAVQLEHLLNRAAAGDFGTIERLKGIAQAGTGWLRFDVAGGRASIAAFAPRRKEQARVMAIGTDMDGTALAAGFAACSLKTAA
jgi:G3E family GTPase